MKRRSFLFGCLGAATLGLFGCTSSTSSPGTIWQISGAETVIKFGSTYGAAEYSLIWKGFEFVDSLDHGREIQTAYQLNGLGESYNPTEAGASADPTGSTKTVILSAAANGKVFTSSVHPAFWAPYQGQVTSPDTMSKTVTIDWNGIVNCVRHDVAVTMAADYQQAVIEGLTGYVSGALTSVYTYSNGSLTPLATPSNKAVPSNLPIVMAKPDGSCAMAIYSPMQSYIAWVNVENAGVGKWDAAWHVVSPCPKGTYTWSVFYIVGTLADVTKKLGLAIEANVAA